MAVWSETALSSVENNWGRFDAEYYKPDFLETEKLLSKIQGVSLRNSCSKIDVGHVGPMVRFYTDDGTTLLQTQNVREFFLDLEHCIKVTPEFHASLTKSQVRKGDILIARSGSFGASAIYLENKVINSADIIIVELNDQRIDPLFAVAFMNTKYGSNQLMRFASGGVQRHVNLRILENFFLPIFEHNLQKQISTNVQRAYDALQSSSESYQQAQHLLESNLDLDKLDFKKPLRYTARFSTIGLSDALNAGRIDAQCFAPNAMFYENWLRNHAQCKRLSHLIEAMVKGRQQEENAKGSTDYCSIKHISGHELTEASKCQPATDTPLAIQENLLLAITGATIGKVGIVKRYKKLAFSGDLLCLKTNSEINPHYLLVALDHTIGQVQFNRWITGSTNGHLAPRDVGRVLVPRLNKGIEAHIAGLVEKSLNKRVESEKLVV